jgi:hypothetical protein
MGPDFGMTEPGPYNRSGLLLKKSDELLHCVQPDCQTTAQVIGRWRIASQDPIPAGLESRLSRVPSLHYRFEWHELEKIARG